MVRAVRTANRAVAVLPIMFAVLVFIALVVNVLGSITGKGDRWGE
jgi:hypothetical protein